MNSDIKTGSVEGTGAAINIELGFHPSYMKVVNIDSANPQKPQLEWISGMAAASALKQAGNVCLADPGLAIGSGSKKKVLIANTVTFLNGGVFYTKTTAEIDFTATTHDIADGYGAIFLLSLQSGGTCTITKGTATLAGTGAVAPACPLNESPIGTVKIVASGAIFNATTDDLDAAHLTVTYTDHGGVDGAAMITANGISLYTGGTIPISLTGTLTVAAGSSSVAGSSTKFLNEVKAGDEIKLGNEIRTVKEVASDTALVLTSACDTAHSGVTAYLEGHRADGVTIGADTDVNVSGETMVYLALR